MFKEAAIGDAYGSGFEFAESEIIDKFNDAQTYRKHVFWPNLLPGMYTDDTQMTIAVAETLAEHNVPSQLDFANSFVRAFQRDPREGYSTGFFNVLSKVDSGQALLQSIQGKSTRCGAAMRSLPLGFLSLSVIPSIAEIQTLVTHKSDIAVLSSQAIAFASHWMLMNGNISFLREFVSDQIKNNLFNTVWDNPVSTESIDVVCAVLTVVEQATSLGDALKRSIALTGDVDTVASLAMGLLSPKYTLLPQTLIDGFEKSQFALKYLDDLETHLRDIRN